MTPLLLPLEYPALFLAGMALGLGVCSATCLPLMGACLLGNSRRPADGLYAAAAFTLGRLLTARPSVRVPVWSRWLPVCI